MIPTSSRPTYKSATLEAWERQADEPPQAFAAFVAFRDIDPEDRTLAELTRRRGRRSYEQYFRMSKRHDWQARVDAYDLWVDRQRRLADVAAIRKMRERHVQLAMSLQGAGALALNKLIEAERNTPGRVLKPRELAELIELGTKLERISRGEPESIVQQTGTTQIETGERSFTLVLQEPPSETPVADIDPALGH